MTINRTQSQLSENSGGAVSPFVAGKNVLANGDLRIWDSGTTITNIPNGFSFMNGWYMAYNGSFATCTVTRQSFTIGNEIPGYESPYYLRWTTTTPTSNTYAYLGKLVDDVRTFAGQTVTFSCWVKASATISSGQYMQFEQNFGNGGSASVYTNTTTPTITTSWQRVILTVTLPSITGKTIGTNNFLKPFFVFASNQAFTVDTWGWQLEAGSVATPFSQGPSSALISLDPANAPVLSGGQGWTGYQVAGKNAIINGGFEIWQRGTSVACNGAFNYGADRWQMYNGTAQTTSQQAAGLTGFRYCARNQRNASSTSTTPIVIDNTLETANAIPYAGQTVTISFWARIGSNFSGASNQIAYQLIGGTGVDQTVAVGMTGQTNIISQGITLTTSWQKFSLTQAVGSTYTELCNRFYYIPTGTAGANDYFEVTGVQLEVGSVATPFSRAGATLQGELALCQRYYYRMNWQQTSSYCCFGYGSINSSTQAQINIVFPVSMRTKPSSLDTGGTIRLTDGATNFAPTSYNLDGNNAMSQATSIFVNYTSGGLTQFRPFFLGSNNDATAYVGFNAEL